MDENKRSKMTRQLQIYYTLTHARIIGPGDIMKDFGISRRMLQRDLKDLRDAGLLNISYDRAADNYITTYDASFDETSQNRRRQHLLRLYRIGTLIRNLGQTDMEELHMYETLLEEYEDAVLESGKDPEQNPPEYIPDKPERPELADLKAEYYTFFPDSNERTRQRDFEEMNRAGFRIYYSRKYRSFIYEYFE
ncbi:MAG: HTH domain-containing protein [Lachnospiraceae bacterium]|nr:HTH domain-containing protein [Lachnospiraceae bacterium]